MKFSTKRQVPLRESAHSEQPWQEVASKQVPDADGFLTDYTWYKNKEKHIFMFGDKDLYGPDEGYADWEVEIYPGNETNADAEAQEWFDSYTGFAELDECRLSESVDWGYYDKFDAIIDKYVPDRGEGDTIASQVATAVNKLVYKWYNDGDVFDNTSGYLEGWANDLSSYANWLFNNVKESQNILQTVYECRSESQYEDLLKKLADALLDETLLTRVEKLPKRDSIYTAEGPYAFVEASDEEEDDYYGFDYEDEEDDDIEEGLNEAASGVDYTITYYRNTACRERRPTTVTGVKRDYKSRNVVSSDDFSAMLRAYLIHENDTTKYQDNAAIISSYDLDFETVEDIKEYFDNCDISDGSIIICKVEQNNRVVYDSGMDLDYFLGELDEKYTNKHLDSIKRSKVLTESDWATNNIRFKAPWQRKLGKIRDTGWWDDMEDEMFDNINIFCGIHVDVVHLENNEGKTEGPYVTEEQTQQAIKDVYKYINKYYSLACGNLYSVEVFDEKSWHPLNSHSTIEGAVKAGNKAVEAVYQDYRIIDLSNNEEVDLSDYVTECNAAPAEINKKLLMEDTTDEYEQFQKIIWGSKRYEFRGSKLVLTNYNTGHEIILDLAEIDEEMFEAIYVGNDSDEIDEEDDF